jgi:hypothetical protein
METRLPLDLHIIALGLNGNYRARINKENSPLGPNCNAGTLLTGKHPELWETFVHGCDFGHRHNWLHIAPYRGGIADVVADVFFLDGGDYYIVIRNLGQNSSLIAIPSPSEF